MKMLLIFAIFAAVLIIVSALVGFHLSGGDAEAAAWITAVTSFIIQTALGVLIKEPK